MRNLSPELLRGLLLSIGTHKDDRLLSPIEVGEAVQQAITAGVTLKELSELVHLESPTMLSRFLRLNRLPQDLKSIIGWGRDETTIPFSTASEIARLDDVDEQKKLAQAILENDLRSGEVREIVQVRFRSGKALDEAIAAILRRRPTIERRYLIIGRLASPDLHVKLGSMDQNSRNMLLQRVLQARLHAPPVAGAKLGTEYFVLSGDEVFQKFLTSLPGGFEHSITTGLQDEYSASQEKQG